MSLQFRIRLPDNTQKILKNVDSKCTVQQLSQQVSEMTKRPWDQMELRYIYPPATLISNNPTSTLESLKITSGNLIVNFVENINKKSSISQDNVANTASKNEEKGIEQPYNEDDYTMLRKTIPDDNSCLFNAIGYLCENRNLNKASELREIVAGIIMSDPNTYNDSMLDENKTNDEYVEWILKNSSWGGEIELNILSQHYNITIVAIDIQTLNVHKYGNYPKCIYLLYDGIHYDALVLAPSKTAPESSYQLQFDTKNDSIMAQALSIAMEYNQKKQFTNIHKFSLKCNVCQTELTGQEEARRHAEYTGHAAFSQIQ